jgi:CheY-like chemotaxis protein
MKFKNVLVDKEPEDHSILIVDDKSENLAAAREVFSDATFASSAEEALKLMEEKSGYDFVLTDLSMETPLAGLRVARRAIQTLRAPILVTNAWMDHGSQTVYIVPGGMSFSRWGCQDALAGKTNLEFWRLLYRTLSGEAVDVGVLKGLPYYEKYSERKEDEQKTFDFKRGSMLVQVSNPLMQKHLRGDESVSKTAFFEKFSSLVFSIYIDYLRDMNLLKGHDEELKMILLEK